MAKLCEVYMIVTAYEQGVGKGRYFASKGVEINNPYEPGTSCYAAWQYGYREGAMQYRSEKEKWEARGPYLYGCGEPEPSLRHMIECYYMKVFDEEEAVKLTEEYIKNY